MEGFVVLLVLALLALPVIAIAAFVRAGRARELTQNLAARVNALERELRELRRGYAGYQRDREAAPAQAPEPPPASVIPKEPPPRDWIAEELRAAPATPAPAVPAKTPPPMTDWTAPKPPPPLPEPIAPAPTHKPAPADITPPRRTPARREISAINWEQFMGAKLFAWIGGLALFLGVAFFVKYSFEHNLIPPEVRVAIGFALGLGLLIGGVAMKRKAYAVTAQTLCSTGVLILYASTFACHGFYHFAFFGPVPTFLLMALITAVAFLLAVRLDAPVVAVLGMLGGFLTPILLSTGEDRPLALFGYIALLDAGVLAVALHRRWNYLAPLGALGTAIMQIGWASRFFVEGGYAWENRVLVPMSVTLGFIALFLGAAFLARRRGWADRTLAFATLLLVCVALGFAFFFLNFASLGARPLLVFGHVFLVAIATLALGFIDATTTRLSGGGALAAQANWLFPLLAAAGTAFLQIRWALSWFARGEFFVANRVLTPMAIALGFILLFLAATVFAKRRGSADRTLAATTLLLITVALGSGFFLLGFPTLAARPALLFAFFFIVDLAVLALVLIDGTLAVAQPLAGLAVFAALGLWTGRSMTDALLNTGLALYLVFAIFHAVVPLVLRRLRASAPPPAWSQCFPALALLLAVWPMLQTSALSFLVWPFILLVDVLAVIVAALTAALLPIVLVLLLTLILVGASIAHIPATLTGLPTSLWMLGGFAVFFVLASTWASRRVMKVGAASSSIVPPEMLAKLLPACSAVLPFLLLIMVVARLPLANPSPIFGLALLLVVLLLGVARLLAVDELPLIGLLSTLALEHAWHARQFDLAHAALPLAWYLGFYAIFTAFPFVFRKDFAGKVLPWAAAALAGPLHFKLVHLLVQTAWPNHAMGLLPAAFAIPTLLAVVTLVKSTPPSSSARNSQLAWFGGVALFFITLIFPIQFDRQWITIGWALEGAALCWLYHRVVHPGLRIVGVALLAVAFARLALNPAVLDYHPRGATAIFNWFLYAYSVFAACLFAAARLLAPPRNLVLGVSVPPLLATLGTVLAFLLVNIEIADYFTAPGAAVVTLSFSGNLARDMSYSIAWAFFALLLVIVGIGKKSAAIRWAGLGLLGITLAKFFLHDLSQLSQLYRIAALIIVAIVAMLASFLYQRFLSADDPKTPPPGS